jgi:hypothetical protein
MRLARAWRSSQPSRTGACLEGFEVLEERHVPSRVKLPEDLQEMSEERVATRQFETPRHHELHHAA